MKTDLMESVAWRWAKLGVMLNVEPAQHTPDMERLLLDTARVASANSRLFILPAGWLALYSDFVAKHRLVRLILDELEIEHRPTLGFLLDWAKAATPANGHRFNQAIDACGSAANAHPLLDVDRRNVDLSRLAEEQASPLSRKWGRWMEDFELKTRALRPDHWIAEQNPSLCERALTGGDLLASVLAECETAAGGIIESESELARRCGVSRPAIREAIRRLCMAGRLRTIDRGKTRAIQLLPRRVA
jgi:hypothetical protein